MCSINKRASTFNAILAVLSSAVLLLVAGCGDESPEPLSEIDLIPFKEMAKSADCADIRNRLFLIDGQQVLWDHKGSCPDNAYSQTLFGSTVDNVLCDLHDSIAGPVSSCRDDLYGSMFDTIIANLDEPDLRLGPEHTVQVIPF